MLRRFVALSLLSISLACVVKVNDGGSGSAGHTDEPSKPDGPGPGAVADPEAEGTPPTRAGTPQAIDCPADADADTYCTDDKKFAGRWAPVDTVRPPAVAETIFQAKHTDIEQQPSLVIALDGDTLYIQKITCGSCRRIIGQGFSGDLAAMSDAQIRDLQDKLGLGSEAPLLDSAQAWRSYVSDDAGYSALTKLSTTTGP
jgi:hypothetical protein